MGGRVWRSGSRSDLCGRRETFLLTLRDTQSLVEVGDKSCGGTKCVFLSVAALVVHHVVLQVIFVFTKSLFLWRKWDTISSEDTFLLFTTLGS